MVLCATFHSEAVVSSSIPKTVPQLSSNSDLGSLQLCVLFSFQCTIGRLKTYYQGEEEGAGVGDNDEGII